LGPRRPALPYPPAPARLSRSQCREAHRIRRTAYWNKPPHPIVAPIVRRVFPHADPVVLIKKLTVYADKDAPGWVIAEREWTDGSKTVERLSSLNSQNYGFLRRPAIRFGLVFE
jgi:hypothetical protein